MKILSNMQIITNEISYKNTGVEGNEFTIQPQFTREIGTIDETHSFTRLKVEILNRQENPFPINIVADITGIFDIKNIPTEQREDFLKKQAVRILMPHIRNMVSSITANALVQPIVIPIIDIENVFSD